MTDEQRVIDVVRAVSPAVVSIVASKDLPVLERCFVSPFGEGDVFGDFFPEFQVPQLCKRGTERREVSSGTGFFVSKDGLVATNRHVVRDTEADYTVIMNDGRRLEAKVIARDPLEDLALVRVPGKDFVHITLGDSSSLQLGQRVIAIGNALGEFQNTISVGVISGLRRTVVASGEELRSLIQTDAAINPGNSGGPLLNLEGRVIGINTAVAAGAENIGFALPVNLLKKDIANVEKHGRVVYPFLGVRYVTIDAKLKEEKRLSVDYGALVAGEGGEAAVSQGSPAEKAGIRAGDIILEISGEKITKDNTLAEIIGKKQVGDTVSLKILRDGKESTVQLALAERKF
ncbi:MAG: trypsin-like peptidase domain-containing protein [Candidatus Ryanbacteria bacterium]|nr:trypsin-like peptidase domain-containing protein [Candidatus Ryanbacteria bacterium]